MASPKLPEHVTVLPLTDPHDVREVFAHDVIINVFDDLMHITFVANRPRDFDPVSGTTQNERVVTGRTVMSSTHAAAMADCIRNTLKGIALHKQQTRPN
jgi:hypothetical protein